MRSVFVKWEKEEKKTEICKGKITKIKGKSERRGERRVADGYKRCSRADYC